MKPCTLWYRRVGTDVSYNHLEGGHNQQPLLPHLPVSGWLPPIFAWLTDEIPPRVVHYSPEEMLDNP